MSTGGIEPLTNFASEKQFVALVISGENRFKTPIVWLVTADDDSCALSILTATDRRRQATTKVPNGQGDRCETI